MNEQTILTYLVKEIDKIRRDQIVFLADGRVENHPEYRHICGVIRGLNHAEQIIEDLVQRLEKSDE